MIGTMSMMIMTEFGTSSKLILTMILDDDANQDYNTDFFTG